MADQVERLRDQFLRLLAHWDELIRSDPNAAAGQARTFMRWVERLEPDSVEASDLRAALWSACLEVIADAEARRR